MRKVPIHRSLYRPILFVGCERIPFIMVTTFGGVMIMAYQSLWVIGCILALYVGSIAWIRRVNENDPHFFKCLYRYMRYFQDFYSANGFYPGKIDHPHWHFE